MFSEGRPVCTSPTTQFGYMQQEWMVVPILIDVVPDRNSAPQCSWSENIAVQSKDKHLAPLVACCEPPSCRGSLRRQSVLRKVQHRSMSTVRMGEQTRVTRANLTYKLISQPLARQWSHATNTLISQPLARKIRNYEHIRSVGKGQGANTHMEDFQWVAASGAENRNNEHIRSVAKTQAKINVYEQLPEGRVNA